MAAKKKLPTGWSIVNPESVGDEDAEFGTPARGKVSAVPMFVDVENLTFCMKEINLGESLQTYMKTLENPGFEIKVDTPVYRRKGSFYIQVSVGLLFIAEERYGLLSFPQTWYIEIDLWGLVRGYRKTFDSWEELSNDQVTTDNDPEDEDSMSVQIEAGPDIAWTQDQLKEALEAYLFPWTASASREATVIRAQWRRGNKVEEGVEVPLSGAAVLP